MYSIVVDSRETSMQEALSHSTYPLVGPIRLAIADYVLMNKNKILALVERKTWSDLLATIRGKRYRNKGALLLARDSIKCRVFYMIENDSIHHSNRAMASMRSYIDHLIWRDNIHVIYTKNRRDSIDTLCKLIDHHNTLLDTEVSPAPSSLSPATLESAAAAAADSLDECSVQITELLDGIHSDHDQVTLPILLDIWSAIPGISRCIANVLIHANIFPIDMLKAWCSSEFADSWIERVSSLSFPHGAIIGMTRVKQWIALLHPHRIARIMISQIPGLTQRHATLWIETVESLNVLVQSLETKQISQFSESYMGKRRVGKIAERLYWLVGALPTVS